MMTLLRHPGRLWRVLVVFSRFFILPKLPFRAPPQPGAVRMRLAIEELGGAWVKLGQMLAMRFDLLPPAYCSELLKLLGQVRPFSYDDVRSIVTEELGAPPEEVFAEFEQRSFAAASIGQVHRAVLHDRRAGRGQGPAARDPRRLPVGHRPDVRGQRHHRPVAAVRRDEIAAGHRRVRALDGRRARLSRRGAPGGVTP